MFFSDLDYVFYCGAISYLMLPTNQTPPPLSEKDLYIWKMGWDYAKTMSSKTKNVNDWL